MKGDTSRNNFDVAAPDPAALVESLRAFGYTPQTAVADLVDNSITAAADQIGVEFNWDGASSRITIMDNGRGMTESQLKQAMRPGSTSPREKRAAEDLGRFGLGLKTASFSQCRRLTVITKTKSSTVHARRWELDTVVATGEWRLLHGYPQNCVDLAERLADQPQGTVVVWQQMDRIVGDVDVDDEDAHRRFLELARSVRSHLSMTFHRFLGARDGRMLTVNGHEVPPWDPFLTRSKARQVLATEELPLDDGMVVVQPIVLPHRSKLTAEEFELAGGERGWNSLQGFYVYRNKRLLVAGDWLGLGFQKEEHYKLARIQVDITNDMDALWQIDVRKSVAQPPGVLRAELRRIAKVTRVRAVEVYRHRGKILTKQKEKGLVSTWVQRVKHGKISYEINRDHPAVIEALENPSPTTVRNLLQIIEGTIPTPLISINSAERPEEQAAPFEGVSSKQLSRLAVELYKSLRRRGDDHAIARDRVLTTDPFQYFPELYEILDVRQGLEVDA